MRKSGLISGQEFPGNGLLDLFGVSAEVQAFFCGSFSAGDEGMLIFSYGAESEIFCTDRHFVPFTAHSWLAGNTNPNQVSHVFLCCSAMEAVAFLALNYSSFPDLGKLLFISLGCLPDRARIAEIVRFYKNKRMACIFGKDLLAGVIDIKIACWLNGKDVAITHHMPGILELKFQDTGYTFHEYKFTLSAFERISGFRSNVRTYKSKNFNSFLEQLSTQMP